MKELTISNYELDVQNSKLACVVQGLKKKVNEFKMMHHEDLKYKEIVEIFETSGLINQVVDQIMKF